MSRKKWYISILYILNSTYFIIINFQCVWSIMALEVFSSIRYFLKPEDISIDNWIFKLHYRFSVALMLGSSAIGVAKQYFGDPINCQVSCCSIITSQGSESYIIHTSIFEGNKNFEPYRVLHLIIYLSQILLMENLNLKLRIVSLLKRELI